MIGFAALSGLSCAGIFGYLKRFQTKHKERLAQLDFNVHVNGIRGKSTVTRMIGGVMREAGIQSIAKTTGSYACVIDPDAGEHPIHRTGPANIAEQYAFIKRWVRGNVNGLVAECMAVNPRYQTICQDTILRSPISVITNVRLDHQELLGDTLEEITASLCSTVPENGVLVTGEREPRLVEIMQQHVEARGSRLVVAYPSEASESLVDKFPYQQFEENIAVVFAVASELGIDQETAARGMVKANPDPGTTSIEDVPTDFVEEFKWVPMFAVNDWQSTVQVFESVREKLPDDYSHVAILNNRSDRTDRAQMFIKLMNEELQDKVARCVLFGDLQEVVQQQLVENGMPEEKIVTTAELNNPTGVELLAQILDDLEGRVAAYGMVNIHTEHATTLRKYLAELEENKLKELTPSGTEESQRGDSSGETIEFPKKGDRRRAGVA